MFPCQADLPNWAWNVFAQHEESMLGKFIRFAPKEAEQLVPAITKPALQAVDSLWSYWQAKAPSHLLFNDVETDVYATLDTKGFFGPSSVPLVKGRSTYVLIPQAYMPEFKKAQNDLVVMRGFGVPH